ncbi:MAG TPA: SdrD B-like domain-containing protein [Marmoricola sp.]|nr:SdrD B-like domain-containing protein [Marmoricola sp.]
MPLYDSYGDNTAPYPPLCGVHYDAATGRPVTEWMFCTDATAHACGETNADGDLVADGVVVGDLEPQTTNPKLTADQARIISFLIQRGHSFTPGPGSWASGGVSRAASDLGTNERIALQALVWCISDQSVATTDAGFATMCAANLPPAEQQRILASVPDPAVLDLRSSSSAAEAATSVKLDLATNLFNEPVRVVASGGTVSLCGADGGVTLSAAGDLVVAKSAPGPARHLSLCVTRGSTGTAAVTISASPPSPDAMVWDQSAYPDAGQSCQHYATFRRTKAPRIGSSATVTFKAKVRVSVGHYVWFDTNRDGVQDRGEAPAKGIAVELLDATGAVIATTKTDARGFYVFTGLTPSTRYRVLFETPSGTAFTRPRQGASEGLDSDAAVATGLTPLFTTPSQGTDSAKTPDLPTIDAGLVVRVTANGGTSGGGSGVLPNTGGPSALLAIWGSSLLLAGAALVLQATRRQRGGRAAS